MFRLAVKLVESRRAILILTKVTQAFEFQQNHGVIMILQTHHPNVHFLHVWTYDEFVEIMVAHMSKKYSLCKNQGDSL
jgi:hypothetical protein